MSRALVTLVCLAAWGAAAEPAPRALKPIPLSVQNPPSFVSAARELADGRILITNHRESLLALLDPHTGSLTPIGRAGGGAERYARPGGLYAGPNGSTLLYDRGQTRVFTISSTGELLGSRSTARRGVSSSADDFDLQQIDAAGRAYFADRGGSTPGAPALEATLVRLEPESQKEEPVARLRLPRSQTIPGGDRMIFTRSFIGSPADGWGVAPDGRVAIVRAEPYRVEWISPDGTVTRGPAIEITPLPMTEADKQAYRERAKARSASVGVAGGSGAGADDLGLLFAETKAPFNPQDVSVSPDGRVWVMRTQPFGVAEVVYDVFDRTARRADRIQLPAGSRIVGFGGASVLVRHEGNGRTELRKYAL